MITFAVGVSISFICTVLVQEFDVLFLFLSVAVEFWKFWLKNVEDFGSFKWFEKRKTYLHNVPEACTLQMRELVQIIQMHQGNNSGSYKRPDWNVSTYNNGRRKMLFLAGVVFMWVRTETWGVVVNIPVENFLSSVNS